MCLLIGSVKVYNYFGWGSTPPPFPLDASRGVAASKKINDLKIYSFKLDCNNYVYGSHAFKSIISFVIEISKSLHWVSNQFGDYNKLTAFKFERTKEQTMTVEKL